MSSASAEHLLLLRRLRRLLLRSQHGQVLFLWGDDARSLDWLRGEIDRSLRAHSRLLKLLPATEGRAPDAAVVLAAALEPAPGTELFALWVSLGGGDNQQLARDDLMARLNERRAALLAPPRAVILVGPAGGDMRAAAVAPDLWGVRSASFEVLGWPAEPQARQVPPSSLPAVPAPTGERLPTVELWDQALAAVSPVRRGWRFWQRPVVKSVNLDLGLDAANEALRQGQLALAERILKQAGERLLAIPKDGAVTEIRLRLRQHGLEGDLALARRQLPQAESQYHRMLQVAERLVALTGESIDALRNWSAALDRVGDVRRALGNLEGAKERYEQSLGIRERLVALTGQSPEVLRDWSVSLDKVGDVQRALGDVAGARARYEQGLGICERLVALTGQSPEALRDWSMSLDKVGDAQRVLGDAAGARERYEQSLGIRERLVALTGESLHALRDLFVSLHRMGDVSQEQGDSLAARRFFERGLATAETALRQSPLSQKLQEDVARASARLADLPPSALP